MAAGIQRAREIQYDKEEHDYLQEQRAKSAREERATHNWLDEQYGAIETDPVKLQAYRDLPVEVKGAVLRQEQTMRALSAQVQAVGDDLEMLASTPRYAKYAEETQARLDADPMSVDIDSLSKEIDKKTEQLAREEATFAVANQKMQKAQEFTATTDPTEYNVPAYTAALNKLGFLIQRHQNPDRPAITELELEKAVDALQLGSVRKDVLDRHDADVEARLQMDQNRIFQETIGTPPGMQTYPGDENATVVPAPTPPAEDPNRMRMNGQQPPPTGGGPAPAPASTPAAPQRPAAPAPQVPAAAPAPAPAQQQAQQAETPPEVAQSLDMARDEKGNLSWDKIRPAELNPAAKAWRWTGMGPNSVQEESKTIRMQRRAGNIVRKHIFEMSGGTPAGAIAAARRIGFSPDDAKKILVEMIERGEIGRD